ncbi:MAG: hypothetical protein IJ187_05785 [Neisseriaceae bacterium]|nr:hypothetical protein [Neisseriaceae bacterium]MBQ9724534.1 hypothetical protein [Neisseriaceae bacterium]
MSSTKENTDNNLKIVIAEIKRVAAEVKQQMKKEREQFAKWSVSTKCSFIFFAILFTILIIVFGMYLFEKTGYSPKIVVWWSTKTWAEKLSDIGSSILILTAYGILILSPPDWAKPFCIRFPRKENRE